MGRVVQVVYRSVHRFLIYFLFLDKVSLIDFEYGGPNVAAFDIGNHFCEFAGIFI